MVLIDGVRSHFLSGNSGLSRDQKVVALGHQTPDQYSPNGVIIEIEQH
jgi:hypothetical protein